MNETISVIIPVYKVEPYLRKCLDSVLNQTYTNLEVILVDDGSPDNCPSICDEYAAKDPRIKVIHKKNGGLSDARNAGLAAASGRYIAFVDSDDWLALDMLEALYQALTRTESDIAVCNFSQVAPNQKSVTQGVETEIVLEKDDALRLLLIDQELQNYVWNKLYVSSLWVDIRFPVGQAFEDINTTWKVFDKAKRSVLTPHIGYFYQIRSSGIVQSQSIKNEIDCVSAGLERYEALSTRFPDSSHIMEASILHTITKVWGLAWQNRRLLRQEEYARKMKSFAGFARCHLKTYAPAEKLGITGRLTLQLLPYAHLWAYYVSHILHQAYLTIHRDV